MGLDMYLSAEKYVPGYRFDNEEETKPYHELVSLFGVEEFVDPDTPSATVSFTVAYWRKANAIHAWFVEHVQGGEDECRPFYVEREQLEELRNLCKQVLENRKKAPELLPTQSGFFFGGTEYDKWYYKDMECTVKQLNRVLSMPGSFEFEYRSSW